MIRINRGAVLVYRVYDVAEEIDLAEVERVLSQAQGEGRVRIDRALRQAVVIRNAPVRVRLGETSFRLGDERLRAESFATILDYGVISISVRVPIPRGASWDELIRLADLINRSGTGADELDAVARGKARELAAQLQSALKRPIDRDTFEDYVMYFLEEVDGAKTGAELLERADVPALMLSEPKLRVSEDSRKQALEDRYQYGEEDLVVIDWNSALVLEPSGSTEIADVLEFALCHLLEVRFYDGILDEQLARLYDEVEVWRARPWYGRWFSKLAREANTQYLEISEVMERVDNSIKVVGDFYFAVVFRAAIRGFRVLDWQSTISRKMQALTRISDMIRDETATYRSHLLELIIVILILVELVVPFLKS